MQMLKSQAVMPEEVAGTANFFLSPEARAGAQRARRETVREAAHIYIYVIYSHI